MDVTMAEAVVQWAQLLQRVENGESVSVLRDGKPVVYLMPAKQASGEVEFDRQSGLIRLLPGWDDPVDLDQFLKGEI